MYSTTRASPHRLFAALPLGERGNEEAVSDLKTRLDDEGSGLRSEASLALWKMTGDYADAIAVGNGLLADSDWPARQIGNSASHWSDNCQEKSRIRRNKRACQRIISFTCRKNCEPFGVRGV